MAARYWVGGAGTWSSANTANWSATSGGAGGASVPTSADTPTFDANSGSGVVTFTNGGVAVSIITLDNANIELSLGAALVQVGSLSLVRGTFTTNNYTYTGLQFNSSNSNTRTINLGSSTVTLSGSTPVVFTNSAGLVFNAGTSSIVLTTGSPTIQGGSGVVFYNVSQTSSPTTITLNGANTFNNLSIAGRTSAGIADVICNANQTINGTLTLSAGTNATMRTFVRSNTIDTTRTLTCAAVASLQDIDFRDITIAGAAAPVSGTRLGDCKGNSGITFDAPKTVYFGRSASSSWGDIVETWALTNGGAISHNNFPLAQDTVIFPSSPTPYPGSGVTILINAAYNIGTIDMSARTSNTMTLATGVQQPAIYGNWINGTGTTISGTGSMTFAGQGSQTITSAGRGFTQGFTIDTPGGSVTLQDAFTTNRSLSSSFTLLAGTFALGSYTATLSGAGSAFRADTFSRARTFDSGTGTLVIGGTGGWSASSTNFTLLGEGTISLTSASSKAFSSTGSLVLSYPTVNQGGTGDLTFIGPHKLANITNTAQGRVFFTGGTIQEFESFNLRGLAGLLQIGSTTSTPVVFKKPGVWNIGANSVNGNSNSSTGFSFTGTNPDYLELMYINAQVISSGNANFFAFF